MKTYEPGPVTMTFDEYQVLFSLITQMTEIPDRDQLIDKELIFRALVIMRGLADQGAKRYEPKVGVSA